METEAEQAINRLAMAINAQTVALKAIHERMPDQPSHHREPTVDPRYEALRAEILALSTKLEVKPRDWEWWSIKQEIDHILAKVAP